MELKLKKAEIDTDEMITATLIVSKIPAREFKKFLNDTREQITGQTSIRE